MSATQRSQMSATQGSHAIEAVPLDEQPGGAPLRPSGKPRAPKRLAGGWLVVRRADDEYRRAPRNGHPLD